jgi:hypothetical protein
LLVKYFIPPVIACDAENADGTKVFGHYECYVFSPYQILGILCVVLRLVLSRKASRHILMPCFWPSHVKYGKMGRS